MLGSSSWWAGLIRGRGRQDIELEHHSCTCSFKNRTSSSFVGFTSKRSTAISSLRGAKRALWDRDTEFDRSSWLTPINFHRPKMYCAHVGATTADVRSLCPAAGFLRPFGGCRQAPPPPMFRWRLLARAPRPQPRRPSLFRSFQNFVPFLFSL